MGQIARKNLAGGTQFCLSVVLYDLRDIAAGFAGGV